MTKQINNEGITPLTIGKLLCNEEKTHYRIPMYQRRYAWGMTEVEQLLQDLLNCPQDKTYYIGTLVVSKHDSEETGSAHYEVIDGQQRLTTLMLIAAYLKSLKFLEIEGASADLLQFENRPKSQATLKALFEDKKPVDSGDFESAPALIGNYDLIKRFFEQGDGKEKSKGFTNFLLEKVVIMRIEVPKDTDVAHYFEIMNNRGEQLEMHEIVKARLLSALQNDNTARACLNQVWEACANMNQYVHFGFKEEARKALFGENYEVFLPANQDDVIKRLDISVTSNSSSECTESQNKTKDDALPECKNVNSLRSILEKAEGTVTGNDQLKEQSDRFQSIVNFPNFLLLVLAIHAGRDKINESTLDDKRLLASFDSLLLAEEDVASKVDNIKKFAFSLLRCRFLLDQFVIKRALDDEDALTLKCRSRSNEKSTPTMAFSETEDINRQIQMLQAAFHVSHPRQAYKYWLLGTLHWLNKQSVDAKTIVGADFLKYLESLAAAFMRDRYLVTEPKEKTPYLDIIFSNSGQPKPRFLYDTYTIAMPKCLSYGRIDNIFVFNYLDYLLWQANRNGSDLFPDEQKNTIEKFIFKSGRGAIEHYFPQKRADEWGENIHAFGNLSLISHEKNSRLSDHDPSKKKSLSGHPDKVPDSIKQHLMMNKLQNNSGSDWNQETMKDHQEKMIELLRTKLSA